jgi:hypothetical protein
MSLGWRNAGNADIRPYDRHEKYAADEARPLVLLVNGTRYSAKGIQATRGGRPSALPSESGAQITPLVEPEVHILCGHLSNWYVRNGSCDVASDFCQAP